MSVRMRLLCAVGALFLVAPAGVAAEEPEKESITRGQALQLVRRAFPQVMLYKWRYVGTRTDQGVRLYEFHLEREPGYDGSASVALDGYLWSATLRPQQSDPQAEPAISAEQAETIARELLARVGSSVPEVWMRSVRGPSAGTRYGHQVFRVKWGQTREGVYLPGVIAFEIDAVTGNVLHFAEARIPLTIDIRRGVSAAEAIEVALEYVGEGSVEAEPRCVVLVWDDGAQQLVWNVPVTLAPGLHYIAMVDAKTGEIVGYPSEPDVEQEEE